jgi:aspartate aminotransferase
MCIEQLAHRTKVIDASGIRKVFALAAELDHPINFSIGQPNFEVPDAIKRAAIEAIEQGFNRYSQTAGEQALRQRIGPSLTSELGWADPNVLITSGVSAGILLTFLALINPGDEVIIPDPYFVIYKHVINMLGGKCVFVDSYPDFNLPVDKIAQHISPKTKLIIVNSPSNPTGVVYSRDELKALAKVAEAHDAIVMSDEIYKPFTYDSDYPSMASVYDKTLLLRGFGKAYAITGWRMGYVAAHPCLNPVLEEMVKIQQYTFVCAPTPFQRAAIAAFDVDISPIVAQYRYKRDLICSALADHFEFTKPGGAFYLFVKAPQGSATKLVERAIANNVLVIPGNVFSEQDTYFRISYATDNATIERGCAILRSLVD